MSVFFQLIVVVADAVYGFSQRNIILVQVFLGVLEHLRNAGNVSEGPRGDGEVLVEVDGGHPEVRVGVNEARSHGFFSKVDVFCFFAGREEGNGSVANFNDPSVLDGHHPSRRPLFVHRQDVPVIVDSIVVILSVSEKAWRFFEDEGEGEGKEEKQKEGFYLHGTFECY